MLGCCCCWQAVSKKPKEKINIAEFFFVERLQKFNLFCLVDAKSPTKSRKQRTKTCVLFVGLRKKSCYEIVKEMKTCSERKKKLVI